MKKYTLTAQTRQILGRKVKQLRKRGEIPATVYGKNVKSVSISVSGDAFEKVYKQTGETGLIELTLGSHVRPVLINSVQRHPVNRDILHVEFRHVDLKEKVKTNVPLALVGEAKAVTDKIGVLLTILDSVEVEALPTNLPENIKLDVSGLAQVNDEFKVKDLKAPTGVVIVDDGQLTLVKVGALVSREAEVLAAEEAARKAAAEAPAEGAQIPTEAPEPIPAVPTEEAKEEKA
ncbi:50S ribosomal protein L25 [Candidatus Gottesmanbacteria bacterium]|nr:50S ribosomal protein L25 [Candidatus Gottesmanbacteria bacterium]